MTDHESFVSQRKKLNAEEEDFLSHLNSIGKKSEEEKLLCEIGNEMLRGKKAKGPTTASQSNNEMVSFKDKVLSYLKQQVEHLHCSLTQISFNMGKFAGNSYKQLKVDIFMISGEWSMLV